MTPKLTAYERQAIRDAVKEASERSKVHRSRRTIPKESLGAFPTGSPEKEWAELVARDAADQFVEIFIAALRRKGAFVIFLE